MLSEKKWVVASFVALAALAFGSFAYAEKKEVKATMTWQGSVEDEALVKEVPAVIASDADLEKVWKALKLEKQPKVDFTKEVIVTATSRGSKLNLNARIDTDTGDLQAIGFGTRDLRPGFRYVFISVSKEGVKTVNGKALGK